GMMQAALEWLGRDLGATVVDGTLRTFNDEFPPLPVYRGEQTVDEYLASASSDLDGVVLPNRQISLEEMLMLWLANQNPAFRPFQELFDDQRLRELTAYPEVIPSLYRFFDTQPRFMGSDVNFLELLQAHIRAAPGSLLDQLRYLAREYAELLSGLDLRVLTGLDMVKEEQKPVFPFDPNWMPPVADFSGVEYEEPERFSPDRDWMPNLVLLAKNTYVWLDQLSRKYQRAIVHLDQVPDEELLAMRRSGITGLWLIGLWERSTASQRIKQMRGNADAVASAYSLFSYDIAADLGGEAAYQALKSQAWRLGIRMASDMVPNHMGIDSRWVIEHPDWFIQLPYSPFPSYTFNGADLSWDSRVGIFLEDHYFNNTDAAVVFKRVDKWTGEERYVYHGNDGTSMPWNDTAQLNYLIPEVREAVIQTILHVARKSPVIRFDAAMTLAKKHFHRLWYPEPGSGGDIASRAEHGMTKAQFDEVFPEEFWRMVVDRVAQEAPDTLLLAEAFWLMEGYFVRTLGMHRVYNSAFMNMLRDEKNAEYRSAIKNTMEFDPEILKRYVNFMNNPDEKTAVEQFGKQEKYFGVCVLLSTLPGLPMIGHGQIEGFAEKYGMEFRYPKWHETPDADLVARHEREVFPLLRKRYLFAGAQDFLLYDFYHPDGYVDENVYAYSNRAGSEAGLVLYHNRFGDTRGWIRVSAAYAVKTAGGDEKALEQRTLDSGLGLDPALGEFTIFREHISGLEYLLPTHDLVEKGMYIELGAYQYQVFMGFRQVSDPDGKYAWLAGELRGRGVPNVDDALREMVLRPLLLPLRELVNPGMLDWLIQNRLDAENFEPLKYNMAVQEAAHKLTALLETAQQFVQPAEPAGELNPAGEPAAADEPAEPAAPDEAAPAVPDPAVLDGSAQTALAHAAQAESPALVKQEVAAADAAGEAEAAAAPAAALTPAALAAQIVKEIEAALRLSALQRDLEARPLEYQLAVKYLLAGPVGQAALAQGEPAVWGPLLVSLAANRLGWIGGAPDAAADPARLSAQRVEDWLVGKTLTGALLDLQVERSTAARSAALLQVLAAQQGWLDELKLPARSADQLIAGWLDSEAGRRFLAVNMHQGSEWFNKEAYEALVWWTAAQALVRLAAQALDPDALHQKARLVYQVSLLLLSAAQRSGYRVDRLLS
ncbi:MAG: alpha-amylase family glycosyl hydrolase, partial [Chloroflexota bacterium]